MSDSGELTEEGLRRELMGFADRFASLSVGAIQEAERVLSEDDQNVRLVGLKQRVTTLTGMYELAVAENISVALLDMMALATLGRMVWEEHWQPNVFGEAGAPVVAVLEELEDDIWTLGARVLSPDQQAELRGAVEAWYEDHPNQRSIGFVRLADIGRASSVMAAADQPGGFFGVQRALSEIDETQALFERTMWFLTRWQIIARWQIELATMGIVTNPSVRGLLGDADDLVTYLPTLPEDVANQGIRVTEELMAQISAEREAAIVQMMDGIAEERRQTLEQIASTDGPRAALNDLRLTIDATTDLVERVDGLVQRLDEMTPERNPDAPPGRPFDITEYRDAIVAASATVERLTELVDHIDKMLASAAIGEGIPKIQAEAERFANALFWRGLILVGILVFTQLLALTFYRGVIVRLIGPRSEGKP